VATPAGSALIKSVEKKGGGGKEGRKKVPSFFFFDDGFCLRFLWHTNGMVCLNEAGYPKRVPVELR